MNNLIKILQANGTKKEDLFANDRFFDNDYNHKVQINKKPDQNNTINSKESLPNVKMKNLKSRNQINYDYNIN